MGEEVEEKIATVSVAMSDALRSAANYEERRAAAPITPADNPIVVEQRIKLMRNAADALESLRASLTRVEEERAKDRAALFAAEDSLETLRRCNGLEVTAACYPALNLVRDACDAFRKADLSRDSGADSK